MNDILNKKALPKEEQALLDSFLADNRLFLGPDPEVMRNHSIAPRTARVWMSDKAATMHGPLVFYWYATTSSPLEVLYGLGQSIVDEIEDQGGIVVAPVEDEPNGVKNTFPWYLVTSNKMDDVQVADASRSDLERSASFGPGPGLTRG